MLGAAGLSTGRAAARGGSAFFSDDQAETTMRQAERVRESLRTGWKSIDIGESVEGRPITMYQRLSARPRAKVLVVAAIHGDERGTAPVAFDLLDVDVPVDVDVHIIPVANPDGRAAETRENARRVDLNRNFPFWWRRDESGRTPASEPETQALMRVVEDVGADINVWIHEPLAYVAPVGPEAQVHATAWATGSGLPFQQHVTQWAGGESWTYHELGLPSMLVESPTRESEVGESHRHQLGFASLLDTV